MQFRSKRASQISFRALKKKLKQREVSEIIEGTVRPLLLYLHCLPAVISPKPTRKLAKKNLSRQIDGSLEANWVAGYC
jgi:hypothetical protein